MMQRDLKNCASVRLRYYGKNEILSCHSGERRNPVNHKTLDPDFHRDDCVGGTTNEFLINQQEQ